MLKVFGDSLRKVDIKYCLLAIALIGAQAANGSELSDLFHNKVDWTKACAVPAPVPVKQELTPEIFPTVIHGTPGRNLGSEQLFAPIMGVGHPLAQLGSSCMAGDKSACRQFSSWVEKLADADALRFDRQKHKGSGSSLATGELSGNNTLRPIAIYTSILRRHDLITLNNRAAVFDWMRRRAGDYVHMDESHPAQNLVLASSVTQLAVGIATSDDALTASAAKVFRAYMDTMRSDGSFPEEAKRGQSALKYENNAIALLVMAAELERTKGVDLYSYRGPNGDIHKAIGFWLDALQNESLISQYAAANVSPTDPAQPGGKQALYFLRPQKDMIQMGWIIPYIQRFPDSGNAKTIRSLIAEKKFPVVDGYDELLGVYPGCVWGSGR